MQLRYPTMSPSHKRNFTLVLAAACMAACIRPLIPVSLPRVENLIWQSHQVVPVAGTTVFLELPSEPNPGRADVSADCDGKPYGDGRSFKLCNAPLAYYPVRYGWVVNYSVFMDTQADPSVFGLPYVNAHGVEWRLVSSPMKETGGVVSALTTLPTGQKIMIQASSTVKTPDGYLEQIARDGAGRFRIIAGN